MSNVLNKISQVYLDQVLNVKKAENEQDLDRWTQTEAKVDKVKSPIYSLPRTQARNERKFGKKGSLEPQGYFGQKPSQAAELSKKRTDEHKAKRGVKTKGMSEEMKPFPTAKVDKKLSSLDKKMASKPYGYKRSDEKNRSFKIKGIKDAVKRGEDPRADTRGGAYAKRGNPPEDHRDHYSSNKKKRVVKPAGVKKESYNNNIFRKEDQKILDIIGNIFENQAMEAQKKTEKPDPQLAAKEKKANMAKKQVLMKKLQAVRMGAGSDIQASYKPSGKKIDEEGYDIARDQGRVRPSKDKKDATSYPPSEEMKKLRKVNKGPSALELVKKKYGKAVMKMDKK